MSYIKVILGTYLLIILPGLSFSQKGIQIQLKKEFAVGVGPNEIGASAGNEGGTLASPQCFFLDSQDQFVVVDNANKCVKFFDATSFQLKRVISDVSFRNAFYGGDFGSAYWLFYDGKVAILDKNFAVTSEIPGVQLPVFTTQSHIWYYSSEPTRVVGYDIKGKELKPNELVQVLRQLNPQIGSEPAFPREINDSLVKSIESRGSLILGRTLATGNFNEQKAFFSLFNGTKWRNPKTDLSTAAALKQSSYHGFVGRAEDGTSYWEFADTTIGVYDGPGNLVAYINYAQIDPESIRLQLVAQGKKPGYLYGSAPIIRIDKLGNIWFMTRYPKAFNVYEVKRTW